MFENGVSTKVCKEPLSLGLRELNQYFLSHGSN